jgi:acetoin utilization protein AcuC
MMLTTEGQTKVFEMFNQMDSKWLAFGGGGYSLEVVPRAWALAFAVMSGHTLDEELPPRYREKYGGRRLRDEESLGLDALMYKRIKDRVEKVVAEVRGRHDISPTEE